MPGRAGHFDPPCGLATRTEHGPIGFERGARRGLGFSQRSRGTVEDDLSTVLAGPRAELDHTICPEDHLRIMLDDHGDVLILRQGPDDPEQSLHVPRVQSDRRFIEHEHRAVERGAQRARQRYPLGLASGERPGRPIQRKVAEADIM